jgi:hypothetical protein
MVKYYVDANGKYLGAYDSGAVPEGPNAIEVQSPPRAWKHDLEWYRVDRRTSSG